MTFLKFWLANELCYESELLKASSERHKRVLVQQQIGSFFEIETALRS